MSVIVAAATGSSAGSSTLAFPILTGLVLTPLIGAIAVLFFGRLRPEWTKIAALTSSVDWRPQPVGTASIRLD